MSKLLFFMVLTLLFLVSCNDDNRVNDVSDDNTQTSSEVINENTIEDTTINNETTNNEPTDSDEESSENPSSSESSQSNIENGGTYTEESDGDWEYLG